MHHLIADGWSGSMLVREMAALYEGRSLPPLAIQYADFAQWQRDWLQGEVLEKQVGYWRERLAGAAALDLATDRPPKPTHGCRGAGVVFEIPPELAEGVQALSRQEGVTLFMTLLTGLEALLHRYTGQSDIVVGSPIAGRNRADVEPLIGFFVNNLVLRTNVSGDPGFRELLGRVRDVTLGAYANQDLPFEKLVEELQPERNLSRSPFFQVMFQLQNMPWPTIPMGDIEITPVERGSLETRFDLEFYLWEQPHLAGVIQYNPDLFDAATIERLAAHYVRVLKGRCRGTGEAALAVIAHDRSRARADSGGLEPHGDRVPQEQFAGVVRGAGGPHSGSHCGGVWGSPDQLPGVEPPSQPVGALPAPARRGTGTRWSGCASSARSRWSWASSASSKREARTSRSIRHTHCRGWL